MTDACGNNFGRVAPKYTRILPFMKLVLASNNSHKLVELRHLLPAGVEALSLADLGYTKPIPEPFDTFRENAFVKAKTIFDFCGLPTLSDDSGICVDALNGGPGVYSARFASEPSNDVRNNKKLIDSLQGITNRKAHYLAILCFISAQGVQFFEGKCEGTILESPVGSNGFGYDPLFVPDGYAESFAQLSPEVKAGISHRARALAAFSSFLKDYATLPLQKATS